jgi:hypothetical protein
MALGSPLVEPVPGRSSGPFWLGQAIGLGAALAGLLRPAWQGRALLAVLLAQVLLPAALQMHYRAWDGPSGFCHDSVLQHEIALRDLRAGINPYSRDYSGTPLARWKGWSENPALHHFVYPPLVLLASVPVEAACRAVLPRLPGKVPQLAERFYDQRLVLLLAAAAFASLAWRLLEGHPHRVALAAVALLNPWLAPFVVEGRNDVALLLPLAGAALAWRRGRPVLADLLVGVAVAAKTLLLPAVPFLLLARREGRLRAAALLLAPLVLTSLPFLLWDARAFLDDVLLAPAGHGSHPFEIRGWGGYGFANLVLALGLATSPRAAFPFLPFQAAAYAFVLWKAWPALLRDRDAPTALLWGLGGVLAVLWFGRFIHDNYVGTLLSAAVIAGAWTGTPTTTPGTSART